jgi:hypothetical protein
MSSRFLTCPNRSPALCLPGARRVHSLTSSPRPLQGTRSLAARLKRSARTSGLTGWAARASSVLGSEWLVIAIWGAAYWIEIDGRIVEDGYWKTNDRPRPWITDEGNELTGIVIGQSITSFALAKHTLTIGIGGLTLSIKEEPECRPILQGSKKPRSFESADDLRKAVFLSPTTELWI